MKNFALRSFTHSVTHSFLFVSTLFSSSCGLLGGGNSDPTGGSCDPVCNGDKTGCPMLSSDLSALDALHAGKSLAEGIVGSSPTWAGAVSGIKITRAGHPSPDPEVSNVLGQEVKLYISGWVFKYCKGMDEVVFGAGPQTSTAQKGCGMINCDAFTPTAEPAVDSAAAIATAFPSEGATDLYKVDFTPSIYQNRRVWAVTSLTQKMTVLVDADTGAVVPQ